MYYILYMSPFLDFVIIFFLPVFYFHYFNSIFWRADILKILISLICQLFFYGSCFWCQDIEICEWSKVEKIASYFFPSRNCTVLDFYLDQWSIWINVRYKLRVFILHKDVHIFQHHLFKRLFFLQHCWYSVYPVYLVGSTSTFLFISIDLCIFFLVPQCLAHNSIKIHLEIRSCAFWNFTLQILSIKMIKKTISRYIIILLLRKQ